MNTKQMLRLSGIALLMGLFMLAVFFTSSIGKALRYDVLALTAKKGSIEAMRYQAIAQALRQGQTTYSFTTDRLPAPMVK